MIFKIKNKVIVYMIPSLEELYVLFGQKVNIRSLISTKSLNLEQKLN